MIKQLFGLIFCFVYATFCVENNDTQNGNDFGDLFEEDTSLVIVSDTMEDGVHLPADVPAIKKLFLLVWVGCYYLYDRAYMLGKDFVKQCTKQGKRVRRRCVASIK